MTRHQAAALVVCCVAVLAYAGSLPSGFVLDDRVVISQSPVVQGTVPLGELPFRDWFGQPPANTVGSYRPVPVLAFWLDWRISRGNPRWFHAMNVLLHGAAMTLAYVVFRGIVGETAAFAGALLAAVLAAPGEAVEGAVGRADLIETIAILAGLATHRRRGWRWGAGSTIALAMALGSKESGVLAPLAWAVMDWLAPADGKRRARWLAYAFVGVGYLALRRIAIGSLELPKTAPFFNPLGAADATGRIFGAAHIFVERYLLGLIEPQRRLYDCSANACLPSSPADPLAWMGLALAVALAASPLLLRQRAPTAAIGLAWFACFFLPVSNLIVPATLTYGERLLYLPSIGLCIALAAAAQAIAARMGSPWPAWSVFGVVAAMNAVCLQWRHLDWRTPVSLYRSGLRYGSASAFVLQNAAEAANFAHRYSEAEDLARRSIAAVPSQPLALTELATALDGEGRTQEAELAYRDALRTNLRVEVVGEYAAFLMGHRRLGEARDLVQRFAQLWPGAPRLLDLQRQIALLMSAEQAVSPPP